MATSSSDSTLTRSFGALSAALGVGPTLVPGPVARLIGLDPRPRNLAVLRLVGVRELAVAAGLFLAPSPALLWARVAGDLMDVPMAVVSAVGKSGRRRTRAWATVGVLAAITAADLAAALRPPADGTASPVVVAPEQSSDPQSYHAAEQPGTGKPGDGVPVLPEN